MTRAPDPAAAGPTGPAPPDPSDGAAAAVDAAFREEWPAVIATLARRTGDLQLAEDSAAEAFATAAVRWPVDGVPPNPGGWLTVTAWRKALDVLRRDRLHTERTAELAGRLRAADAVPAHEEVGMDPVLADDRLRLVLACCHPALAAEARVALTLRFVAGLSTAEIADAFLQPEATLAQRLVRAKRKIAQAGIRFELPGPDALPDRIGGALAVVYLVFSEGYAASRDAGVVRADLCAEAVWLGRLLRRLLPTDAEVGGLLALMLLHAARLATRLDPDGRPVRLDEQDRARWDRAAIAEGLAVLDATLARRQPGRFQVEAAIAALHAGAPSVEATDWPQVAALYRILGRLAPSPVVEVNRAVAVGRADGPRAGLAVLAPVLTAGTLTGYAPLHAAHADLLLRSGDRDGAAAAWTRAAAASANPAVRSELERRVADPGGA